MEDYRDNEMPRGLNQALYKYLPESWIDFYLKNIRMGYTAKVKNWNSIKLENINERRVLDSVSEAVESFKNSGSGGVKGFGSTIVNKNYDILIPKCGEYSDILAEVEPLTFFCSNSNCNKIHSFPSSYKFLKNPDNRFCNKCSKPLKQIQLVYACKCGWAEGVTPISCYKDKNHGRKYLKSGKKFNFICGKCGTSMQMIRKCPECEKMVYPRQALDWGQFIPTTLSLIDLVDLNEEKFLLDEEYGAKLIIAYWLGKIDNVELSNYINGTIKILSGKEKEEKIKELTEKFVEQNIPAEYARKAAETSVNDECGSKNMQDILDFISQKLNNLNENYLKRTATSILEYNRIFNSENISTLNEAAKIAKVLDTNASPELYAETARKFGIKHAQVSGDIPFIFTTYGYTRREKSGYDVCLRAFPQERSEKKNIYAVKLLTEGILLEFDRKKIIQWLLKNNFIEEEYIPSNLDDDTELKVWFMNNVNIDAIEPFNEIDFSKFKLTSIVYTLIHSISHSLIRQASQLCGLDKDSLSEYIFPNLPAVAIYCQNSQGYNIGALFNLFEAYFDRWLNSLIEEIEKCVYDPICIDRDKACPGCLFLNEISCSHFNKDLNRRYLTGWFDKVSKTRTYGFWEGL